MVPPVHPPPFGRDARLDHLLEESVDELLAFTDARLDHLLEESVDELLAVAEVAALREVVRLLTPPAARVVKLKVPQEIVGDFEVRSDGEDFVDQVFDADDAELAQPLLDDVVVEGASSALQFSVSALVDEFFDRLEVGITPGDVRVSDTQHAQRRLVQLDKSGVVNLTQTKELKNLSDSGMESVDTPDPHDDGQLGLGGNVEVAVFAGVSGEANLLRIRRRVLLGVGLGLLEDRHALRLVRLFLEKRGLDFVGAQFGVCLALLQQRLGDRGNRLSCHLFLFFFFIFFFLYQK